VKSGTEFGTEVMSLERPLGQRHDNNPADNDCSPKRDIEKEIQVAQKRHRQALAMDELDPDRRFTEWLLPDKETLAATYISRCCQLGTTANWFDFLLVNSCSFNNFSLTN